MGVTIKSPKSKIDMGYGGLFRMRADIAAIADQELGQHYEDMLKLRFDDKSASEAYDRKLDKIIKRYINEHGKNAAKIFNFLYTHDDGGQISYGCCKELLKVFSDEQRKDATQKFSDTVYGYAGWGDDAARGKDFMQILNECVKAMKPMEWF